MHLPIPALSPQDLADSGMLLGRRHRIHAPVHHSAGPGCWQAFDELLWRPVDVQFLPPGASLAAVELAAMRAAARLTVPRIARIFDADDSGERPYLVCERAPGLAAALRVVQLSSDRASANWPLFIWW